MVSLHVVVHFHCSGNCVFVNAALHMDGEESTLFGQISPYISLTKSTLNSKQALNHHNFCGYW